MLETYVNGFAYNLQQQLAPYGNTSVYTNMTIDQFSNALMNGQVSLPCVLFQSSSTPSTRTSFMSLTQNNQWTQRSFDWNMFPMAIVVAAHIFASDLQSAQNVTQFMQSYFSNGVTLLFQNPYIPTEKIPITLKCGAVDSPQQMPMFGLIKAGVILAEGIDVPYFFNPNDFSLIGRSTSIERELISAACICSKAMNEIVAPDPNMAQQMRIQYWNRLNQICDQLGIPSQASEALPQDKQPRSPMALFEMVRSMNENEELHIADAYHSYVMNACGQANKNAPGDELTWKEAILGDMTKDEFIDGVIDNLDQNGTVNREVAETAVALFKEGSRFLKTERKNR